MIASLIQILVFPQRWNKIQKLGTIQLVMENLIKQGHNYFFQHFQYCEFSVII